MLDLFRRAQSGQFCCFVGHLETSQASQIKDVREVDSQKGRRPFEVWVNGAEQPRGLAALAKSIPMDMRSNDRGWLETKLKSLMKAQGDDGFLLAMPPDGELVRVPSLVAGFASWCITAVWNWEPSKARGIPRCWMR